MKQNTLKMKDVAATFIIFNSRATAAATAQVVHSQIANTWSAMPAFEPRQVVWKNLAIPFYERMIRQIVVKVIVFLTVVFYMIPITFIFAFTTVNKLKKLFPFLKSIVGKKAIEGIVEAYLPQLALILFLYFLPIILLMLSKAEGNTFKNPCSESFISKVFLI